MRLRTCDRCNRDRRDVHSTGYHRTADARAGEGMTTLAYLCEDCLEIVFGEFISLDTDGMAPPHRIDDATRGDDADD